MLESLSMFSRIFKEWLMVSTKGLFLIDWGMFRPSLEEVLFLVWVVAKVDLRVEMCVLEVRSGWDLSNSKFFLLENPRRRVFGVYVICSRVGSLG